MSAAFRRDVRCYYHPLAMRILALDTTARHGSVALVTDGRVEALLVSGGASQPARRLPGELAEVLDHAGVTLDAVDALAVAAGPGSFTGLRIGISTMQGLALATGRPLLGISALDALAYVAAHDEPDPEHVIGAWIDAWRGEVYAARFSADGTPDGDPIVARPAEALAQLGNAHALRVGNGVAAHREELATLAPTAHLADPLAPPLAPAVAMLAARAVAGGARPAPHAIRPIYVRRPDAEIARGTRA